MKSVTADAFAKIIDCPVRPASFRVSGDEIPQDERMSFYQDIVGRYLLNVELDMFSKEDASYNSTFHSLPGLSVAVAHCSPLRGNRTRERIADSNAEEVILAVSMRGAMQMTWLGRELSGLDGQAALMPTYEPCSVGWAKPGSFLMYGVPLKLLALLVPDVDNALFKIVPSSNEALRLLTNYHHDLE